MNRRSPVNESPPRLEGRVRARGKLSGTHGTGLELGQMEVNEEALISVSSFCFAPLRDGSTSGLRQACGLNVR